MSDVCTALQLPCNSTCSFTDITAEAEIRDALFPPANSLLHYKVSKFADFSESFLCLSFFFFLPELKRMFLNTDSLAAQRCFFFLKTQKIPPFKRKNYF